MVGIEIESLTNVLMFVELYVALASLVGLFVCHESPKLYPIPLWSTTRYVVVLLVLWPLLLVAVPFLYFKNRHRTAASVKAELRARRGAAVAEMFKRQGLTVSAALLDGEPLVLDDTHKKTR